MPLWASHYLYYIVRQQLKNNENKKRMVNFKK